MGLPEGWANETQAWGAGGPLCNLHLHIKQAARNIPSVSDITIGTMQKKTIARYFWAVQPGRSLSEHSLLQGQPQNQDCLVGKKCRGDPFALLVFDAEVMDWMQ